MCGGKKIVYSQRVEIIESYQERRDCADQNIPLFLEACGYIPVPIPNVIQRLEQFINTVNPAGIVLTGGNSLVCYGGNAPEKDATDKQLIEIALKNGLPLYGFCRGMQSILDYFGCKLENVEGHVAVRHFVNGMWGKFEVNSYHNQACLQVKDPLQITEITEDGAIEAIECQQYKLMATMWHPERENPFRQSDMERVQNLFK